MRVDRQGARDAAAQRILDDEVQRAQLWQLVAPHGAGREMGEVRAHAVRRQLAPQHLPAFLAVGDHRDVRRVALVAGACGEPYEVRLRIAARTPDRAAAEAVGAEVRSLHMQGPAGAGGGVNFGARQILAVKSVLIPREWVTPEVVMERAA